VARLFAAHNAFAQTCNHDGGQQTGDPHPMRSGVQRATTRTAICGIAMTLLGMPAAQADPLGEKVQLCDGCHGENGIPQEKTMPVIWGQMAGYLYLQLRDYKRGNRANDIMASVVANMDRSDMLAVAEYFSKKSWPNRQQPSAPSDVALKARQANSSIGCTGCHLDAFQGTGSVPRLAGQSQQYMTKTIAEFRSHQRANNPGMSGLMNATSESDIAALTEYLAGL
jgi:cytochrome c553